MLSATGGILSQGMSSSQWLAGQSPATGDDVGDLGLRVGAVGIAGLDEFVDGSTARSLIKSDKHPRYRSYNKAAC